MTRYDDGDFVGAVCIGNSSECSGFIEFCGDFSVRTGFSVGDFFSHMATIMPIVLKRMGVDPAVAAGPFVTTANDITGITIYLTLATLFLAGVALWRRQALPWRTHWRHFAVLGLFNTALPFWLFAYAAQQATASLLSVLNATAPAWGYVIGLMLRQEPWSTRRGLGLLLGLVGVALLILPGASGWRVQDLGGTLLCLGATCCYGIAANYAKRSEAREPFLNAFGTLAGNDPGPLIRPVRETPVTAWHRERGAVFYESGANWRRPGYYPRPGESMDEAVRRECRAVRHAVGVYDSSPLGKFEIAGPDAAAFLERVLACRVGDLQVGRGRYAMALREDGRAIGSVSGGCIEDDLVSRMHDQQFTGTLPFKLTYGVTKEEANRIGLPCGGTLELVVEPSPDPALLDALGARLARRELTVKRVDIDHGSVTLSDAQRGEAMNWDGQQLVTVHGPQWRLLIVGAGQISRYLAQMAQALDYDITVCDPREEYSSGWDVPGTHLVTTMPDDTLLAMVPDARCGVIALTHDPKLDDLVLIEALRSPAFYVGAVGSRLNNDRRRDRLTQHFDLTDSEMARLHGPIGLPIGSHTPPEIAVAILAELVAVRNGVSSLALTTPPPRTTDLVACALT